MGDVLVPLGLLPLGLLVNSIFYGGVAALLWHGVRRVIRRERLDRGRCPACAYDLAGTRLEEAITCSECGLVVTAALFDRPRQLLRWWMVPLALPPLILGAAMFFDGIDWRSLRLTLGLRAWPFGGLNAIILVGMTVWLSLIALYAYDDRPRTGRLALAFITGVTLSLISWTSLAALLGHYGAG